MPVWWLCALPIMRALVEKPSRPARPEALESPPHAWSPFSDSGPVSYRRNDWRTVVGWLHLSFA
jgi:hypothetical protein